ncbi:anaerobic ribonucleoside triphosphate reductase [Paenibacillus alvei]|uniref:anaerobic ribonucleoside triphosphate reductase n=1 Tax=Paenibacillus alvei TaxID=44250 RepID=UPI002282C4DC|nr:anaerobic ribonucleoside triphosphate reductase [Paenibacillus alvei]MCY9737504.1 anaerobic ribonucleoside triphosphate reductase [Paenibacillus alvei]
MKVIKRDGAIVRFDQHKISTAICSTMKTTEEGLDVRLAAKIAEKIRDKVNKEGKDKTVEEIQDMVEYELMVSNRKDVARAYITYRNKRSEERLKRTGIFKMGEDIIGSKDLDVIKENANLNGESFSGKMSKFGSEYSKMYAKKFVLPKRVLKAMEEGYIHVHDLDHYILGTHNCLFVPFEKLLRDGFNVSDKGSVRSPNSIMTAMAQVAVIFQCQQNAQFGGLGAAKFDWDMAPYVKKSFVKHFRKGQKYFDENVYISDNVINIDSDMLRADFPNSYDYALHETQIETQQAAESLIHNLNTMASRAGGQVPFTSICFGTCTSKEGQLVIDSLLDASIRGLGHGETAIFPQMIFQCKKGINQAEGEPNYELFLKAIECSSKRLFPCFVNVDADFNLEHYDPNNPDKTVATMGCRTRVIGDRHGDGSQSGRGNLSFNTINLPKLGIDYGTAFSIEDDGAPDVEGFYQKLDEVLEITLEGLLHRYHIQSNQPAKASDFMMMNGCWKDGEKLKPDEPVKELFKHGSISIGFVGLAECLKAMFGKHHGEDEYVWKFGYSIVKHMRDYCDSMSEKLDMNISLFGTPAESLAGKFAMKLREQYGVIEGVTDREYITNSSHIPVYFNISAFKKIELEAPFHKLCNAGHNAYIELDGNARNNQAAFLKIVQYALFKNMGYFTINHPVDKCNKCGYDGVIGDNCPSCGVEAEDNVSRIRRITGYLVGSLDRFNSGKAAEERDRVKHSVEE